MKRLLALLLCLVMCLSLLPAASATEDIEVVGFEDEEEDPIVIIDPEPGEPGEPDPDPEPAADPELGLPMMQEDPNAEIIASGQCGDDVYWKLQNNGTMYMSGSGSTWDFPQEYPDFYSYRDQITRVVFSLSDSTDIRLGDYLFWGLSGVTMIELPYSLVEIGPKVFGNCSALESVIFYSLTPVFDPEAFSGLSATVYYPPLYSWTAEVLQDYGGSPIWVRDDEIGDDATWYLDNAGWLIIRGSGAVTQTAAFNYVSELAKTVWIQEGITSLCSYAVYFMDETESLILPETLESIGDYCFGYCKKLEYANIPASVSSIGEGAFYRCSALDTVYFHGSAPSIGDDAFYDVTATAQYPQEDLSWTSDVRQDYGGTITWMPYAAAPMIATDPWDAYARSGETVTFVVGAYNAESYQWQYRTSNTGSWSNSTAADAASQYFSVEAKDYRSGYQYRCKVSNGYGTVTSKAATLIVYTKPVIVQQPGSVSLQTGQTASFTVVAAGAESYQWQYRTSANGSWSNSSAADAKTATLSIKVESYRDGYQYRCKVTNGDGTTYSAAATLTVMAKPVINVQPKSMTADPYATVSFSVNATGADTYQWQYRTSSSGSWNNCSGNDEHIPSLSIQAAPYRSGYQYRCKCTNPAGTTISSAATLTVNGGSTKPTITTQPKSVTAFAGESVSFTVAATGATGYQWQYRKSSSGSWSDSTTSGCKAVTLTVTAEEYRSGYQYRCKVTNPSGTTYSNAATLTVLPAVKPTITTQPKSLTADPNATVTFKVTASGAVSYQWQYRSSPAGEWSNSSATGAKTATLTIVAATHRSGYQYRCRVTNPFGTTNTNAATLLVTGVKPTIVTQPKSQTAYVGESASFTVAASGATGYQWQYRTSSSGSWSDSSATGAKTATLTIAAESHRNGYQYRCKVTNLAGITYSSAATLTVTTMPKPTITTQPKSQTVMEGATVKFSVSASNAESYQWQYRTSSSGSWSDSSATGAKTATLTIAAESHRNGYQYRCKVTNAGGTTTSNAATLTVKVPTVPTITKQPTDVSINEDQTANFTLTASDATSYQWYWWKASEGAWVKCGGDSGKTATLTFTEVEYAWDGYYFYCKVTNSVGSVNSDTVQLHILNRCEPEIHGWPLSRTITEGEKVSFKVTAKHADGYQWYWRKNSSDEWHTISAGTYATLSYASVPLSWNGYQFICKVYNSVYSTYIPTVTLTVKASVTYRALLVGEVNYHDDDVTTRNQGNVDMMEEVLNAVTGPEGGSYSITRRIDIGKEDLKQLIKDTFADADSNDVSLFFISTHGATGFATGEQAGRLTLIGETADEHMTIKELAACLNEVSGKVVVIINSCGSGAAVFSENNAIESDEWAAAEEFAFNEAVISAFAELEAPGEAEPETGELRTSKFYVLTACEHQKSGWTPNRIADSYAAFPYCIKEGLIGSMAADADGNGTVTLSELQSFVTDMLANGGPYFDPATGEFFYAPDTSNTRSQKPQVYPENSSYALFK